MKAIHRYIFLSVTALCPVAAAAQNLDPTVEISRAYEGKIAQAQKPVRDMTVPDSVSTFRLDFDYSVFDKPYKGAYDFNPYLMSMRPTASAYTPQTFYLKAGAGYRLHPELDLIWSPSLRNGLNLDVYAAHKSYVGDYRNIGITEGGRLAETDKAARYNGYDLLSKAGVDLKYGWGAGVAGLNVDYYGVTGKFAQGHTRGYDAVDVNFSIASNKEADKNFIYDLTVDYRFGEDKMHFGADSYLTEHLGTANLSLGPVFKHGHRIMFDLGAEVAAYRSAVDGTAAGLNFTPRYLLRRGRWSVDAGVRLDLLFASIQPVPLYVTDNQQYVYPDVHVGFAAIKDAMNIYAAVTGGTRMNTYSSLLDDNHHFSLAYAHPSAYFFDADIERVRATFGFRGRIASKFSYDIRGGYANYANGLLPAVYVLEGVPVPGIAYAGYQKVFAALDWRWDAESFKFDGTVAYTHEWGYQRADWAFAPAALTGSVAFEYNWMRRIFAGVDCDFSTGRKMIAAPAGMESLTIPGYADLGVSVEYAMNRKLSFWLRGGNLCCMTIQRTPLYAEGGISFTAGICLNL